MECRKEYPRKWSGDGSKAESMTISKEGWRRGLESVSVRCQDVAVSPSDHQCRSGLSVV